MPNPVTYLIYNQAGRAVSVGTVLANPMPPTLTVVALTDLEASDFLNGRATWDEVQRKIVPTPPAPPSTEQRVTAIQGVLIDKTVITQAEVDAKIQQGGASAVIAFFLRAPARVKQTAVVAAGGGVAIGALKAIEAVIN